jgi:hypothetical protein
MPKEQIKEFVIYGTQEEVLNEIESLENVGMEYFIVDLDPSRELEQLELFADKIMKNLS